MSVSTSIGATLEKDVSKLTDSKITPSPGGMSLSVLVSDKIGVGVEAVNTATGVSGENFLFHASISAAPSSRRATINPTLNIVIIVSTAFTRSSTV